MWPLIYLLEHVFITSEFTLYLHRSLQSSPAKPTRFAAADGPRESQGGEKQRDFHPVFDSSANGTCEGHSFGRMKGFNAEQAVFLSCSKGPT
jgi:hypothetical protein